MTWFAITSPDGQRVIRNTAGFGFPLYLTNGTKVATSTEQAEGGLYSGSLLAKINIDLDGKPAGRTPGRVWTGTDQDGSLKTGNALGDDNPVYGSAQVQADFQFFPATQANDQQSPMYAISGLLEATGVPEPSCLRMLTAAIVLFGLYRFIFRSGR